MSLMFLPHFDFFAIFYSLEPPQHGINLFSIIKKKRLLMVTSSMRLPSNASWVRTTQNACLSQLIMKYQLISRSLPCFGDSPLLLPPIHFQFVSVNVNSVTSTLSCNGGKQVTSVICCFRLLKYIAYVILCLSLCSGLGGNYRCCNYAPIADLFGKKCKGSGWLVPPFNFKLSLI